MLLSNDDGADAPGLCALASALDADNRHEIWVVAPTSERSAQSHSLTMHKPLRAHHKGERRWAVSGTPADCVYVALHHLMRASPPDLVLSGINYGSNLGADVHYSGTVAAAREACLHGIRSIAVSLHRPPDDPEQEMRWETAIHVVRRLLDAWTESPKGVFLNVNVPNVLPERLRGLRTARLGERFYQSLVDERVDPRGRPYLWIGGPHIGFGEDSVTDGPSIAAGWATVTPLSADVTDERELIKLRALTDG